MTRRHTLGLTILLAACGTPGSEAGTKASTPATSRPEAAADQGAGATAGSPADRIRIERTPCFGTCPVFAIEVAGDGAVSFEGRANTLLAGKANGRVSPALAASLFHHADSIGVAAMADSYKEGAPGCGRYAADAPTVTLAVHRGASTKTVSVDYGCSQAPRSLRPLHARLDSIARALGWIPKE